MSILIEGISVVVAIKTIEEKYRGGFEQYLEDCPTLYCTDDLLVAVMFQMPDDVYRWIRRLEVHGLIFIKNGKFTDIAVVDLWNGLKSKCDWLIFSKIRIHTIDNEVDEKISCCRLKGTKSNSFELPAFPPGWTYNDVLNSKYSYISLDETYERLQYLEHKDGVDVFKDTETEKKVYVARPFGGGDELRMSFDFLEKGIELVGPHLPLIQENLNPGDPETDEGKRDMAKGFEYLKEAVRLHPHNGWAHWYMGKAYQALWDYERAYDYFKSAYNLEPDKSSFCGALMEACWYLNKTEEAVAVAKAALRLRPKDPAWISDYGYSLFKDGQIQKGKKMLLKAHRMDPEDPHNIGRLNMISERMSKVQNPLRLGVLICDHENGSGGEVATILQEELCDKFYLDFYFHTSGGSIMKIYKEHLIDIIVVNPAALSFHKETGYNPSKEFRREMTLSTLHDFYSFHQSRAIVLDPWKDSRFLASFEGSCTAINVPCNSQNLVNDLRNWIDDAIPGLEAELLTEKIKILLFGHEIEVLTFLAQWLSLEGFQCQTAFDADSAYEVFNTNRIDILITGQHPPEIDLPHLIADVKDAVDTKIIVMMEFEDVEEGKLILYDGADALYERDTPMIRIPAIITKLLTALYPEEEIKKRIKKGMRNIVECRRHEKSKDDLII